MAATKSDPGQTEAQGTTPAVQSASGYRSCTGVERHKPWLRPMLRHELRTPLNAIIGYSEMPAP